MSDISFLDMPKQYNTIINQINKKTIHNILSKFKLLYFPYLAFLKKAENDNAYIKGDQNNNKFETFLHHYLMNFKFSNYD